MEAKQTHRSPRRTSGSEEAGRSCWDDFDAVRGQMDRLFRRRSPGIPRAVDTATAREDTAA